MVGKIKEHKNVVLIGRKNKLKKVVFKNKEI